MMVGARRFGWKSSESPVPNCAVASFGHASGVTSFQSDIRNKFFFATIFVHTSFLIFNPHLLFEDDGSDQYDGASSNIHAALKQKRTLPRRLPNG
jgi:hypothetical protein